MSKSTNIIALLLLLIALFAGNNDSVAGVLPKDSFHPEKSISQFSFASDEGMLSQQIRIASAGASFQTNKNQNLDIYFTRRTSSLFINTSFPLASGNVTPVRSLPLYLALRQLLI